MPIDSNAFRETMSNWASGVTIVTSLYDGKPLGITASSFSSVSLEPPQILVCVAKRLFTHKVVEEGGCFAVNILGVEHLAWGMRFAGMMPEMSDRFHDIAYRSEATGAPILPGVLGWLDCQLRHIYDGGDHSIFVGEVVGCGGVVDQEPLLYFNRAWRQLATDLPTIE